MMVKVWTLVVLLGVSALAQHAPGTGGVRGTVLAADGTPVSGAPIVVSSAVDSKFSASGQTDAAGKYAVGDIPAGGVTVVAQGQEERVIAIGEAVVTAGATVTVDLRTQ